MRIVVFVLLACVSPGLAATAAAQTLPSKSTTRQALTHYFEGQRYLAAERWDEASREFATAIKLHPLLTDAHYGLGHAYMGLERFTSAALSFQKCLETARTVHGMQESARVRADHQTLDVIDEIRDTIRRRGADTLRARQLDAYVTRLRATRPSLSAAFEPPAAVLLSLGSAHFRLGNTGRAEYYWTEAARVDPALGEAWNNLAVIYLELGQKAAAEEALNNAERAGITPNPRLRERIQRLK